MARDVDMDALGMGADYFSEDDTHYAKNDRATGFSGVNDDHFERNRGISNVNTGNPFGPREHESAPTFEARGGGGGFRSSGISARKGGRNDKQRREPKKRRQDKKDKKDKKDNVWEKRQE